jgi:hypothetical protein
MEASNPNLKKFKLRNVLAKAIQIAVWVSDHKREIWDLTKITDAQANVLFSQGSTLIEKVEKAPQKDA